MATRRTSRSKKSTSSKRSSARPSARKSGARSIARKALALAGVRAVKKRRSSAR